MVDASVRVFESLDALAASPDVSSTKEVSGGHVIVSLVNGKTLAARRVPLERTAESPELSSPACIARCPSAASAGAGLANDDATSPLLGSVFARGSPSPLPDALLRTPERARGEPVCPAAPARVIRVFPKRVREIKSCAAELLAAANEHVRCPCAASGAGSCAHLKH